MAVEETMEEVEVETMAGDNSLFTSWGRNEFILFDVSFDLLGMG